MNYLPFGGTGKSVSRLGFGCMRLPMAFTAGGPQVDVQAATDMLQRGLKLGINYFDTAYFYHNGQSERILGAALGKRRSEVNVATKCPGNLVNKKGDLRRILEEQLGRLSTGYIDFYHFHGINYDEFQRIDAKAGWYEDAVAAKNEGLIKHISFSFHSSDFQSPAPDDMMKLIDTGYFESVLCQYNVLDQSNAAAMAYAKKKGLGVVIMGPLGGGRVSGLPAEVAAKLGIDTAASAELGLRFVAANPNVDVILSGMSSMEQLEQNVGFVSNLRPLSSSEADGITAMMQENKRLAELYCTGCNYCMPCPQEVNIPYIFQMMNYYKVYGIEEFAQNGYRGIGSGWIKGKKADACNQCGACEKKCPQGLKIREQLIESHAALK
ncbi:MAG: aldo/keto reductase [Eubacteriales bacterium]